MKQLIEKLTQERDNLIEQAKAITIAINVIRNQSEAPASFRESMKTQEPFKDVVAKNRPAVQRVIQKRKVFGRVNAKEIVRLGGSKQVLTAMLSFGKSPYTAKDLYRKLDTMMYNLNTSMVEKAMATKRAKKKVNFEKIDGVWLYSNNANTGHQGTGRKKNRGGGDAV